MRRASLPTRRPVLLVEQLESRFTPSGLVIPLDPARDTMGQEVIAAQAYNDLTRSTFGIFDTGSSVVTFSALAQSLFTQKGEPIPIAVPGGARGEGVGGQITGDVSQPGRILVGGLDDASMSIDNNGNAQFDFLTIPVGTGSGNGQSWGIQAFVGTPTGSPNLPTLAGTPILVATPDHPHGLAGYVNFHGTQLNFPQGDSTQAVQFPDLHLVAPGTPMPDLPNVIGSVRMPVSLVGNDNHLSPGDRVTETPVPVFNSVLLKSNGAYVAHLNFLFDTGSQLTVISSASARALGLDLTNPAFTLNAGGVGGGAGLPGYYLDELDLPGGLTLTDVPVVVMDVSGVDGIIGMNCFNLAAEMQYDPYSPSGPSVEVCFLDPATRGGGDTGTGGTGGGTVNLLQSFHVPFATAVQGTAVPRLSVYSGEIRGQLFLDYNANGIADSMEPALSGVTVYVDTNGNGQLDPGEPQTLTGTDGSYSFIALPQGSYAVRAVAPSGLVTVSPNGGGMTASVWSERTVTVPFGLVPGQRDAPSAYVAELYGTILDRAPDAAGLSGWIKILQSGTPRPQITQAFWESPEHRGQQVDALYQQILGRTPDAAGRAFWIKTLLAGATTANVERALLASPEYQASHPDAASFLKGLYNQVLGRDPDPASESILLNAMQNGLSRAEVAGALLASDESIRRLVDGYYLAFLHRPSDPTSSDTWVDLIERGQVSQDAMAESFLASDECVEWAGHLLLS
jgi:hypothetical protein